MKKSLLTGAVASALTLGAPSASAVLPSMATGVGGWTVSAPVLTVGETISSTTGALNPSTIGDYTPVGVLDGLGAYDDGGTFVRVFANHELLNFRGYPYEVSNGSGGTFALEGARVSYFDIDKVSKQIVDAGIAYDTIYDANGAVASDLSFLLEGFDGFSRFCSSILFKAGEYGFVDTIYFTGEEDGGGFNPVGGAEWALDVVNGEIWQLPALGRGAWENITALSTGDSDTIALLLSDDTSPFNADGKPKGKAKASGGNGKAKGKGKGVVASGFAHDEAAPLYLYIGTKSGGDFLERNGLSGGTLYVWVSSTGETTPADFNGSGTLNGTWVEIDNSQQMDLASEDGSSGYDEYGYPTQRTLWTRAKALGAFGFSRPEDVATNPADGTEAVLASTGVDTYEVDPKSKNGVDTFGTIYTIKTDFSTLSADLTIIYDGDADPARKLRSPDNLDWADDGLIYVQEDKAEDDTTSGDEVLFGSGAVNPDEAGIVQLNPTTGTVVRVANIDRGVVLDASLADPADAIDRDAGDAGEWESSGIIDVSTLFGETEGSLYLFTVQAHGIEDQADPDEEPNNPTSRINDDDLVEGGQLLFLSKP